MKVNSESEVAQSCLTRSDPMDCSLPGSSVHGIFQARVLEWGAIAFSYTDFSEDLKCMQDGNMDVRFFQKYIEKVLFMFSLFQWDKVINYP